MYHTKQGIFRKKYKNSSRDLYKYTSLGYNYKIAAMSPPSSIFSSYDIHEKKYTATQCQHVVTAYLKSTVTFFQLLNIVIDKAVTVHFTSKLLLHFGFVKQLSAVSACLSRQPISRAFKS